MDSGFYRGTNSEQDGRFSDKEKKLLKTMKFESVLDTKVNLSKVNMEVIKPWITDKINELMGAEDDVLVEYCFTQLEEANVNPKIMQINLTGFLNARMAREFMAELWQLFIDAQASPDGIPSAIVGKKMEEMKMWSNNGKQRDSTSLSAARPAASELSKSTESDWNNRYQSLTGGRYGGRDRGTSAATPASETTPQRRARSPSPPSHRRGRSPSPPSHRRGSSRRRDRDVERRSERGRGDRERSHERSRDRSRERDRHFERDRDRSRDRERERERNRERDHSRERGAGVRDREREREERFRDYLNSNRTSDRGKERHRDETKEAQIEAARDKQQPDSEDEFGPSEGVLRKRTSSHSSASNHSKSSSPQRANVAATATHGDYEEDDSADEAHRRKLVSSKVVIRQYSENEKDAKKLDFESDDEKHKKKRKRKKEHRNEEDSDAERKSKKHKKEKRKKRDKDDD